jgi:hypothetical protein
MGKDTDTTLMMPTADTRYVPPPADPFAGTDISQLLQVPHTFVDTEAMVTSMLDALPIHDSVTPLLSNDLEGLNLGRRNGDTYLMQIYDSKARHIYTIDICSLGRNAFETPASDGEMTLRKLLESEGVLKLLCDVRSNSRARFKDFDIHLRGIKDIQNMKLAYRQDPAGRQWRNGLARLIKTWAGLSRDEECRFNDYKTSARDICGKWEYDDDHIPDADDYWEIASSDSDIGAGCSLLKCICRSISGWVNGIFSARPSAL